MVGSGHPPRSSPPAPESEPPRGNSCLDWAALLSQGAGEIVALVVQGGQLRFIGGATRELLGLEKDGLETWPPLDLVHPDDRRLLGRLLNLHQSPLGTEVAVRFRVRHREGHFVPLEVHAVNLLPDPRVGAMLLHCHPWTEPTGNEDGPFGEDEFLRQIQRAIARAQRKPEWGFCLIRLEVDQIKTLLGTHGADTATRAADKVAARLARWLRPGDELHQQSVGEFLILLNDVSDNQAAMNRAYRFKKALERELRLDGRVLALSATLGMASSARAYQHAEQVMRDALAAANHARGRRTTKPEIFRTQMRVADAQQITLAADLKVALKQNEFLLHYQPIVSLADQRVVGFEGLLRWRNPERGMVSPAEFIPIAERTGLIVPIGRLVLEHGCSQLAAWKDRLRADSPLFLSLNLSPRQFADDELYDWVQEVIERSGVDPASLKLEVTESAVLDNLEGAVALIQRFRELGVRFSLDDFGTGYSSFSYLYQLPYDTLKLDMSFIRGLGRNPKQDSIVASVIALGRALGMEVVAEGVETAEQADMLRDLGCPLAQGYLFSKPLPAALTDRLL
jgi:EAL domain-containing protein (putative c-di-GMP-specific phosphodiesterase class I)/GGDEF domain-containing protein